MYIGVWEALSTYHWVKIVNKKYIKIYINYGQRIITVQLVSDNLNKFNTLLK